MQRVSVQGAPLERGRQYGRAASALIRRCLVAYRDVFEHRAGLRWNDAIAHAATFLPDIESFMPDALQEMRGIADGAAIPFEAVLVLNCRSELMFAAARSKGETPPSECTSFAATPDAVEGRHVLLGQNWDWVPFARDVCVLADSVAKIDAFTSARDRWVIEGCYADLVEVAAASCTELVFLNPGIDACVANCRARPWEPHKYPSKEAQDANLEMLIGWVRAYATRTDEFSLAGHRALFERFGGAKREITSLA